jgi:hypothetical protein
LSYRDVEEMMNMLRKGQAALVARLFGVVV